MTRPPDFQLGHFWPSGSKSSDAWAGVLEQGDFPEVTVCNLHSSKFESKDGIFYGVLSSKQIATLFECTVVPSKQEWRNFGARVDDKDVPNRQYGRRIIANYMCVSISPFEQQANIIRISFCSNIAEKALVLWSRRTGTKEGQEWATVASRFVSSKGVRLRIQQRIISTGEGQSGCRVIISFVSPVTPKEAYSALSKTRVLISLVCGSYVDVIDAILTKKEENRCYPANLVFYNPSLDEDLTNDGHRAALPVTRNSNLMRNVTDSWFLQSEQIEIASRIFIQVLKEHDVISFDQIKNLVTCLEMILSEKTKPLKRSAFAELRNAFSQICDRLASANPSQKAGFDIVQSRIDLLNSINTKPKMKKAVESLGQEMASRQFGDPDAFVSQAVDIRNKATHDPSRLTAADYKKLHWLAVKLRMLVAMTLWKELAKADHEINQSTPIVFRSSSFGKSLP